MKCAAEGLNVFAVKHSKFLDIYDSKKIPEFKD